MTSNVGEPQGNQIPIELTYLQQTDQAPSPTNAGASEQLLKSTDATKEAASPIVGNTEESRIQEMISLESLENPSTSKATEFIANLAQKAVKWTETARSFTMLNTTSHSILRLDRVADIAYGLEAAGTSGVNKLATVAAELDMYASGSNLLANLVLIGSMTGKRAYINLQLKSNPTPQRRAQLNHQLDKINADLKSKTWKAKFGSSLLASVSYFAGSVIALAQPTATIAAVTFGNIGFGVAYATSKAIALKGNMEKMDTIHSKILKMKGDSVGKNKNIQNLLSLKINSLRHEINNKQSLGVIQNLVDVNVGLAAAAAGITALIPGVNIVAIPLAALLGTSLLCKVAISAYRNLRTPASRERTTLRLKITTLQVKRFFTRGKPTPESTSKLATLKDSYEKVRAAEHTASEEGDVLERVGAFLQDTSDDSTTLKTSIAEELGVFDEAGNADPTSIGQSHILQWLGK